MVPPAGIAPTRRRSKRRILNLLDDGGVEWGDRSVTLRLGRYHKPRHYFYATATVGYRGTVRTFTAWFQRPVDYRYFLTEPSSRILTLKASKKTTGYIDSSGRFCHSTTSSKTKSVTVLIRSADTSTLYCSSRKRWISRTVIPWAYMAMIF